MSVKEIECIILDDKYEDDDFEINAKIDTQPPKTPELYAWDGFEWSVKGFNRVYTNRNSQYDYDEFLERIYKLRDTGLLYEIAYDLEVDQSYFFKEERIYLYIESKKILDE